MVACRLGLMACPKAVLCTKRSHGRTTANLAHPDYVCVHLIPRDSNLYTQAKVNLSEKNLLFFIKPEYPHIRRNPMKG